VAGEKFAGELSTGVHRVTIKHDHQFTKKFHYSDLPKNSIQAEKISLLA